MPMQIISPEIDLPALIAQLTERGVASFKILAEEFRLVLLEEARGYPYTPLSEVVGSGEKVVRQQMSRFNDFSAHSKYILLEDSFQAWLTNELDRWERDPFVYPLDLNSYELVKYEPGSLGITPHRDGFRYKNIICIFIIAGHGRFFVPGNVIVMRAPGFVGPGSRPFHFVKDIQTTRYVFGLRQKIN
jgi:hypothetical protein